MDTYFNEYELDRGIRLEQKHQVSVNERIIDRQYSNIFGLQGVQFP